jgi:hypothetical protein
MWGIALKEPNKQICHLEPDSPLRLICRRPNVGCPVETIVLQEGVISRWFHLKHIECAGRKYTAFQCVKNIFFIDNTTSGTGNQMIPTYSSIRTYARHHCKGIGIH